MKINLSKEHLKKACKLSNLYSTRDGESIYTIKGTAFSGFVKDPDSPFYRDFLQLVIEKIREDYKIIFAFHKDKPNDLYVAEIYFSNFKKHHVFRGCKTMAEAKEKAIVCVLDHILSIR